MVIKLFMQVYDFDYTGQIQSIILPSGRYKLQVWGANGGGWGGHTDSSHAGGYSEGIIKLLTQTTIFIVCGGRGSCPHYPSGSSYNGGGVSPGYGSAGGATHIAKRTGLLKDLANYKDDVLIVAGGGGSNGWWGQGGYGGGLKSGPSWQQANSSTGYYFENGGTQDAGGILNPNFPCAIGQFGQGANGGSQGGCGGGGWYGGSSTQGSYCGGGGGGSGYIGEVLEGQCISGNQQILSPTGQQEIGHIGNGFARISTLEVTLLRRNSNFYKDSIPRKYFDFLKMLDEE